jgi:hypothetical protein
MQIDDILNNLYVNGSYTYHLFLCSSLHVNHAQSVCMFCLIIGIKKKHFPTDH